MSDGDHEQARLEVLRRCGVRTAGADVTPIPEAPKGVPSLAPNIKLGEDEVRDILGAPAERGVIARLARKHNVTPAWVSAIRKGRTRWTRATGPLLAGPQSGPDVVGRLG